MVTGDAIAQFVIEKRRFAFPKSESETNLCYDKNRSIRFAIYGSCIAVSAFWHFWGNRLFSSKNKDFLSKKKLISYVIEIAYSEGSDIGLCKSSLV